jgi:pyruvate/2-oxoglutarate dehydrogenase complex dihydrolipoamide acyltransferase (E2) component
MSYKLELPDIGEGVVEAEIQQWFVAEGDVVEEDQPLVEVMTDKATVVIPSPKRGRILKRFHEVGATAKVHSPLVEMDLEAAGAPAARAPEPPRAPPPKREAVEDEQPTAEAAPTAAELRAAAGAEAPRAPGGKSLATPAVRALARELSIDINAVSGSGPGGRVTKDDLNAFRRGTNGHGRPELKVASPAAREGTAAPSAPR